MEIIKKTQRTLTALAVFFLAALSAAAQNVKLTISDLVFEPNKPKEVSIYLENDVPAGRVIGGDIVFPEGFKFTNLNSNPDAAGIYMQRTSRCPSALTVQSSTMRENDQLADGTLRFLLSSTAGKKIAAGSGAILKFEVTAPADFSAIQAEKVKLKDITIGGIGDENKSMTFTKEVPLYDSNFIVTFGAEDINATPSQVSTVTVSMDNTMGVCALEGVITLPEGLSFVKNAEDEYCTAAERVASLHYITTTKVGNAGNQVKFLVDAGTPVDIVGNSGPIFTFDVKGDASLAKNAIIKITDIYGSTIRGDLKDIKPITINVTNPDVDAIATAEQAIAALKTTLSESEAALAEYAEDIQAQLAQKLQNAKDEVGAIETAATASKNNGTAAADLEALQTRINNASAAIKGLVDEAADIKKAQEEAAAKKAEDDQFAANNTAIATLRTDLAAAKDAAAKAGIGEAQAAEFAALETAITDLNAKIEANHASGKSVEAKEEVDGLLKGVNDRIAAINKAVAAANNATQNKADKAALAAVQTSLSETNTTIATYDETVQALVADSKAAAEQAVAKADAAILASFEAGTSVADKEANAALVAAAAAAVTKLSEDAKAAQDKFLADAAAAANEAQNVADKAALAAVQTSLSEANTTIATYDESVQALVADSKTAAEKAIADADAAILASFEAGTSVADKEANAALVAAAAAAVTKLSEEAKAAQDKFLADAAAAANEAQNVADKAALAAVQTSLSEANTTIATYADSVQALVADFKTAAEQAIAAADAAILASFEAGTSVADKEANAALVAAAATAVTKLSEDAKAAQDKFLADAAAAANDAQNKADKAALAAVQTSLSEANTTIATYDESVQALVADSKTAAEKAIADADAAILASFEAGTSVADKEANAALVAAAAAAVTKLSEEAKAAQDANELAKQNFVVTKEFTSVEEIADNTFVLIDKASGKALFGSDAQNLAYDVYEKAFVNTNSGYRFKLETPAEDAEDAEIANYNLLRLYTPAGEPYNVWGKPGYVNSQPNAQGSWCSFILGLNNQNGEDFKNGAVWELQYSEGKGFALLNKGTGLYLNNAGPANNEAPVYWTLATIAMKNAINIAEVEGGTITADEIGIEGKTITVTATPAEGFILKSISVKAGETDVQVSNGTFVMPNSPVTVSAVFVPVPELAVLADGDYIVKNVATGKYLGGANAWGTKASVVDDARFFTLTKLENGKYTFDSHAYNNAADKHFLNGEWTDGLANEISIFKTEAGLSFGTAIDACYAPKAEGTELTAAAYVLADNAAWEFISVADAVAALEAGEATDATFLLKDASISRNLYNASFEKVWEGDSFAKGGPNENQNAEKWGGNSQTFDAYQTINVPNGTYTVSVQGYYRYNNTTDNTNEVAIAAHADGTEVIYSYLYANDKEVPFASIADDEAAAALEALPFSQADAAAAFAQGLYKNSVEVVVTDGTLTVGVKKTEHIGCDWTVWDNFTLTRTGDVPALAKVENMALSVAEDAVIDEDGTFPVVFGYTATADESLTMPAGSISYTVTAEGKEPINGETDFDVDKDARNIYIAGLEYGTEYTIAINSLSVSYFDLETGESKVVFEQKFEAGELTATFTTNAKPEEPEPIEPDAWYIADKFKVNEYIDGNRVDVATARFVADPTNAENGCIEVITNDNAAETWNAQLFVVSDVEFAAGDVVSLEMKVRADRAQTSDTQLHKNPGEYVHWQAVGNVNFTTEWTAFAGTVTIDASWPTGMKTIAFNLSEKAGQSNRIYFDDVKLTVTKPDGINGVNAGAKANRKVRVNGQIMIIKNGQKSTVSGVTLK